MKYLAADGRQFDSAKECRAYEKSLKAAKPNDPAQEAADILSKATYEEILAAMSGKDAVVGKALETGGRLARNARYESGDFKRQPKKAPEPMAAATPPAPPPAEALPQAAE